MTTMDDPRLSRVDVFEALHDRLGRLLSRFEDRSRPVVTLSYAQSIDGCIAPVGGGTLQISNRQSQQMTHQIRALHDTILVGINTVLCDDPRLTVRLADGESPQPIVLDSRLRFPLEAKLLRHPNLPPIIATGPDACPRSAERLTAAGATIIRLPLVEDGRIDLAALLPQIKSMGYQSVMVEGGAEVITNMLATRVVDQLVLAISPRLVGGLRAVHPIQARQLMPQLHDVCYQLMDGDLVVWGNFAACEGADQSAAG